MKKTLSPPLRMGEVAELLGWVDRSSTPRQLKSAAVRARRMLRRIERERGCRLLHGRENARGPGRRYYTTVALLQRHCGELIDYKTYVDRQVTERIGKFMTEQSEELRVLKGVVMAMGARLRELEKK